ncbi:MAG: 16S rRNA (cytosine(967)-C(5))-methyltransferase RsmB [Bacteroidota bacterium]|nr:16S rRNA (cytosine(967)-C(5))-methyltransferase RsmB [Bacteroidota bacterium]MDW8137790.1 16S rRNA (cytosine(967)-C(5))-methyltransferase RsmB [Bacteroidota bacterium]
MPRRSAIPRPAPQAPMRQWALYALRRVAEEGAFAARLADAERLTIPQRPQVTELVQGALRWRRYVDFLLARWYRRADRLEPAVRAMLWIGLYELRFTSAPTPVVVNAWTEIAREYLHEGAAKLVHALLRRALREPRWPEPDVEDAVQRLGIRYSYPDWIVEGWLRCWGRERTEALLRWGNERPRFAVRLNPRRVRSWQDLGLSSETLERLRPEPVEGLERTFWVHALAPLRGALLRGMLAVQDPASAWVVRLLDPQPGERILDLCAAPGGKTLLIAELMADQGEVWAIEVHPGRSRYLEGAVGRYGARCVRVLQADGRRWRQGLFDRVLVDAPCTGLGVLAKRADLRWARQPEDVPKLVALQRELLENAAQLVRPGGVLLYATCTLWPEENEEQVQAFLARHPEFTLESACGWVPAGWVQESGWMVSFPPDTGADGVFAARLRRHR